MVDGAEASSLTVFSDHRFVRCAPAYEVGSVVVGLESLSGLPPALISTACFDPLRDEVIGTRRRYALPGRPSTCARWGR